jgi:hypothetical protein
MQHLKLCAVIRASLRRPWAAGGRRPREGGMNRDLRSGQAFSALAIDDGFRPHSGLSWGDPRRGAYRRTAVVISRSAAGPGFLDRSLAWHLIEAGQGIR